MEETKNIYDRVIAPVPVPFIDECLDYARDELPERFSAYEAVCYMNILLPVYLYNKQPQDYNWGRVFVSDIIYLMKPKHGFSPSVYCVFSVDGIRYMVAVICDPKFDVTDIRDEHTLVVTGQLIDSGVLLLRQMLEDNNDGEEPDGIADGIANCDQ